jgi:glutathionylspermidine synthase
VAMDYRGKLSEMPYPLRRETIYGQLRQDSVFTWDCMYGEEYALAGIHRIERSVHQRVMEAAEGLMTVYARTVQIVQQADDALLEELGLPRSAFAAVRLSLDASMPTVIGRFDFAVNGTDIKMLEFNSDTPTGIVEVFHVNGKLCKAYEMHDPNEGCAERLNQAFEQAVDIYRSVGYKTDRIYFSSLDWHEEDAGTTRYLLSQSGLKATFVPLSALRVNGDRLWVLDEASGKLLPIDVLYRLHALEKLAEDLDEEDDYPTGEHVLQLIAERKLAVINPPSGFIAQTKALQALIWNLHLAGQFYSEEEHAIIESYMLPTFLENRFAAGSSGNAESEAYVVKPILGREGSGVRIYGTDGLTLEQNHEDEYNDQLMVYQRYTELPSITVETLNGMTEGRLLWGCFVVGGQASAIILRVGGHITNNLSYYLPVGFN